MPHVSRKPVEKDVYQDISESLNWLLTDISSEGQMKLFLNDFFTKTERLMLAKRLAVALMISQKYDADIITHVLKVSTATVYRINEWVDRSGPGLQMGLRKLTREKKLRRF